MLPDRVSNPGPLTYESGALPIGLRGPAARFAEECTIYPTASGGCLGPRPPASEIFFRMFSSFYLCHCLL